MRMEILQQYKCVMDSLSWSLQNLAVCCWLVEEFCRRHDSPPAHAFAVRGLKVHNGVAPRPRTHTLFGVISVNCFAGGEHWTYNAHALYLAYPGGIWQHSLRSNSLFWRRSCFCSGSLLLLFSTALFFTSAAELTPHPSHPLSISAPPPSFDSRFWACWSVYFCIVVLDVAFIFFLCLSLFHVVSVHAWV